ncbi:MAG: hypothetical protein MI923_28280 [Phycisphaerales bacterium]|nr:hypothetical protein [Phycisphaerales bacterium]
MAGFVSIVVALQLDGETGMLNAIRRTEYRTLISRSDRPARLMRDEQAAWDKFGARLRASLADNQKVKRYDAVNRLQTLLVEGPSGADEFSIDLQLSALLEADGENFVTRLAAAFVYVRELDARNNPVPDALTRYKHCKDMIIQGVPSRRTRLYRKEYSAVWHSALEAFILREDVRTVLSIRMPQQFSQTHDDHYQGLQILCDDLRQLSRALRRDGHTAEAVRCEQWLTRLTLGLLEQEADAPTQLLCARLLLDAHKSNSAVATPLQALVEDYHRHADSSPRDLTDQSLSSFGGPAVDPAKYLSAFGSLVVVALLCCLAAGGMLLFLFTAPFAVLKRKTIEPDSMPVPKLRWYGRGLILLLPSSFTCTLLVAKATGSFYSATWIALVVAVTLSLGALYAVVCAGFFEKTGLKAYGLRMAITSTFALVLLAMLALSPSTLTSIGRKLDLLIGAVVIVVPTLVTMILAGIVICPARLRAIASAAALAWCVNISAALAVLQYHRWADSRHRQAVVEARKDEFAAVLGKGWREKYVTPVRDALELEAP